MFSIECITHGLQGMLLQQVMDGGTQTMRSRSEWFGCGTFLQSVQDPFPGMRVDNPRMSYSESCLFGCSSLC